MESQESVESGCQCGAMTGRSCSLPVATRSHCSGSSSLEGDNFVCLQGVGSRENNLDGLMALKGLVRVYYSILRNSYMTKSEQRVSVSLLSHLGTSY